KVAEQQRKWLIRHQTWVKIYYFQEKGNPYSMQFMETGHFARKFGKGFFDEAGKSYNDLARIERGLL
ncbi:MAG: hypothetical protein ACI4UK_12355, partial [Floccifex sp.]